jgi:hypothetical protein
MPVSTPVCVSLCVLCVLCVRRCCEWGCYVLKGRPLPCTPMVTPGTVSFGHSSLLWASSAAEQAYLLCTECKLCSSSTSWNTYTTTWQVEGGLVEYERIMRSAEQGTRLCTRFPYKVLSLSTKPEVPWWGVNLTHPVCCSLGGVLLAGRLLAVHCAAIGAGECTQGRHEVLGVHTLRHGHHLHSGPLGGWWRVCWPVDRW